MARHSPVPIGTVPIYEAVTRVKRDRGAGGARRHLPMIARRITGIV
jgi:thiamine biosynthesis protein ThiC